MADSMCGNCLSWQFLANVRDENGDLIMLGNCLNEEAQAGLVDVDYFCSEFYLRLADDD